MRWLRQLFRSHSSRQTELPRLAEYRAVFEGRMSIKEYRALPETPAFITTCCNCGKRLH